MWVVRLIGSTRVPSGRAAFDPYVCYWFAELKCFVDGRATCLQPMWSWTGGNESIVIDVRMLVDEMRSVPSCS